MKILLIILISFAQIYFANAKTLKATPTQGTVVFNATAIGLKFQGTGEGPEGEVIVDKSVQGTLKFKMETLDTKINMRNQHMKEKYLETAKYPYSELKIEDVTGFVLDKPEGSFPFKGTITVHNVAKPVAGMVHVVKAGDALKIKAEFDTKISNFSIPLPAYAGVALKDDVKVVVETQLM